MTLLELLLKGGWVMVPLLLLSILMLYAIIERLITFGKGTSVQPSWLENIQKHIKAGDIQSALLLCKQKNDVVAKVIKVGIKNLDKKPQAIEASMESAGQAAIYQLEKNLSLLGTIAGVAPMLGFLGTVLGMIQAFMTMAQTTGAITPQILSAGIYEAMITTAAGLVVGIIADLAYKYLLTRVQKAAFHIEYAARQFMLFLQKTL